MPDTTTKTDQRRGAAVEPIAIVGIGCRFAGGIDSPAGLWSLLERGGNAVREVPPERWAADEVYDPQPGVPGRTVSRWGGFLDDIGGFDTAAFGITEYEAEAMDPQHRMLTQVAWEALEHAGIAPGSLKGSQTGVFFGLAHHDYLLRTFDDSLVDNPYVMTGNAHSVGAGRVSYLLGLHGPAVAVDTACSSGLLSVHLGCQSLRAGESDLALAGAAMLQLGPEVGVLFSQWSMLSPHGRCAAFDAAADGFVRSEGCAVVALQRLDDALRDGNRVLAVIRGSAANADGRSDNIVVPSATAQEAVQRSALRAAAVDPSAVELVEAHGPGTPTGDPVEFRALSAVYGAGDKPCALGSVKTNIGHTESVSGVAGLIKAVMSLRHRKIPGNLHFTEWNPDISPDGTRLYVPTELREWHANGSPRLASVSSYGFSGTNVHVVLEEAPDTAVPVVLPAPAEKAFPVLLSGSTPQALAETAGRVAQWLSDAGRSVPLADIGRTLARGREHRAERLVALASSHGELAGQLTAAAAARPAPGLVSGTVGSHSGAPVWVFSGQGSQWAGMGRVLLETEPAFGAMIDELEPLIAREAGFSVRAELVADETVTGIEKVQPTIFAVQVALAAAWRSRGVEPAAVIGHSLGETAASVVAGALAPDDGVKVICRRSRLITRIAGGGAMATIELPHQEVAAELAAAGIEDVTVAVIASAGSTVVAGNPARVDELVAGWEARDLHARRIAVDYASHSPHVDPILDELAERLEDLAPAAATVPVYGTVLDDPKKPAAFDAGYWVHNLRRPVRFADAVTAAVLDGHRIFVELSPHPLLIHAITETAKSIGRDATAVPTLRRDGDQSTGLLPRLADLHCSGVPVDWARAYPAGDLVDVPLPAWAGTDLGVLALRVRKPGARVDAHPLLGVHVHPVDAGDEHTWQATISGRDLRYLADHQVHDQPVLPGAAYCEMGLAAAKTVFGAGLDTVEVADLTIHEMLHLDEHTVVSSRTRPAGDGVVRFESLTRRDGEDPTLLATGTLRVRTAAEPDRLDVAGLLAAHPGSLSPRAAYAKFHGAGVRHGDAFAALVALHLSEEPGVGQTVLAELALPAAVRGDLGSYGMHPVLLDGCLQTLAAHPALIRDAFPVGAGALRVHRDPHRARYCLARLRRLDEQLAVGDVALLDEDGAVVAEVTGIRLATTDRRLAERLLAVGWDRADFPQPAAAAGPWLVLTEPAAAPEPFAAELTSALGAGTTHLTLDVTADDLEAHLATQAPQGLVVVCPAPTGTAGHDAVERAQRRVKRLIGLVRSLVERTDGHRPRLWVLTRDAQQVGAGDGLNLEQTALRGLCRVIGHEHPELAICHLDTDAATAPRRVAELLGANGDADEVALRGGELFLARLKVAPLHDGDRRVRPIRHGRDRYALAARHAGDLGSLELVAAEPRALAPDELEIRVEAFGLNYADVLNAMGLYKTVDGSPMPFGFDCAGTVVAVGADVTAFRAGDRVAAMHPGAFHAFAVVPACKANRIPDDVTFAAAAARPSVFATAWYGLHRLSGLGAGERVLIHSATGGVGLAAIAVARHLGAEIYATAGTDAKRQYLRDLGIEHVFDSRSTDFADRIRELTGGEGVDVVLNSLTGAAQRAGLDLLRIGGRFVELGKKDIYADARIGLFPFRRNISLHSVDLGVLPYEHLGGILREVHELLAAGALTPVPHTTYPLAEAASAFRTLASGGHVGKLVLAVPQHGEGEAVVRPDDVPVIRADGAYVVTGGLGGLGLIIARWFAGEGAGRVILNGRSAPSTEAQATIDELRAGGADIEVVRGDIAAAGTAGELVRAATATGLPLRGVVHAAAVVDDAAITGVDDALVERVWAPKVRGALRLHEACADSELDWWFGFSSASALVGFAGQACYASANALLDGLTTWRRGHGLPALSVNWGAWAEHGRGTMFADRGNAMIDPDEGVKACDALLRRDRARAGYLAILDAGWQAMFAEKIRTSPFFAAIPADRDADQGGDTAGYPVLAELRTADPAARQRFLEQHLTAHAAEILRVDAAGLDPDRSLTDHGLDSLMALELSTRINREFDIRVTPKQMRQDASPSALAAHIVARLDLGAAQ
ncbi:polyketide synthase 5 [Amycolatopsis tolypomycina]|uniref:Polyketide synthase 5 n=1 Tax=Amycolatopsis tolypomycina TaxID=208445 RepID=A0A1H4VKP7_9PSEU|nr:type I polyketide synthase [Amycolatopsis tolypomycina]SEC81679.1 polyketide synthase 5 [Amycolatopsis tolypomycina]